MPRLVMAALGAAVALAAGGAASAGPQPATAQDQPERLVVFETFGRLNCGICRNAGPVVNALARSPEYQGKVLWLEHDVDDNADSRKRQWWAAKRADDPAATSATTPLILVDGGRTYADGRAQPFEARYRELVDEALTEPPQVTIEALQEPGAEPNRLTVSGTITNLSEQTIGYATTATLWFMAFEEKHVIHVDWFVRRAVSKTLDDDLDPGQTITFSQELQLPDGSDMEAAQVVVTLDYRPVDRGGAYWAANAALASKFAPIATPAIPPTEQPTADPGEDPTAQPTAEATDTPPVETQAPPAAERFLYLPIANPVGGGT